MNRRKKSRVFVRSAALCVLLFASYFLCSLPNAGASNNSNVRMFFFYSRDCKDCLEIKENLIPELNKKYNLRIEVRYLEINEPENYKLQLELEKKSRPLKNPPPAIFIGSNALDGEKEIKEKLEGLIEYYLSVGGCDWPEAAIQRTAEERTPYLEKFKNLRMPVVIGAGLLDGLNPCAFSTIIFLVSYLTLIGRKNRDVLFVGSAFTFAVFITYFFIGLGLFELIRILRIFTILSRVTSLLIAALAALLGILSVYDYYKIKKGRLNEMVLQLPAAVRNKIHSTIREESKMRNFILGSFIMGFLVAFLEFPCTGQVYLPIIFVLRNMSEFRLRAVSYLMLYNLMFILPLIVVFFLAYEGTSSQRLIELMHSNVGKVKIFTAILFFSLAAILIF